MKYYLHDCNAFNDEKITQLFMEFGYEGLGLFYTLLEKLALQEKPVKTEVLKQQLHVGKKLEKCWSFMESIGIIQSNNGETFNEQLLKFSEKYQIKKEKNNERISEWRENQRGTKNVTRNESVRNAPKVKESKEKEIEVKESKSINTSGEASSLFGDMKNYFLQWYREKRGSEYYFQGKDGVAIKSLIKKIEFSGREKNPENSDAKKLEGFKWLLEHLPDWVFNGVTLSKIDSQFNAIKDNGTGKKVIPINQSPNRNLSAEYLADLARRSGASGGV